MDGIIVNKTQRFLKLYYKVFFPADEICEWLSVENEKALQFREFAITGPNGLFKRYLSFANKEEMINTICKETPAKIDISAIYNFCPQYHNRINLKPMRKELVFDIDLTDYDEVRICCSGTDICEKCWNYMVIACKVLNASLREDWGFKHILWVFSGRRGIHVWVCDKDVQWLDGNQRAAIADYFQLIKGNIFGKSRVFIKKMHFSIRRALNIIEPYFIPKIVEEQDMLGTTKRIDKFLACLPTKDIKNKVSTLFSKYITSADRWQAFLHYIEMEKNNEVLLEHRFLVQEIILRYCYPRLDANVTTGINHLLKLPFSVHPATKQIAIILDVNKVALFNPKTSPSVQSLWDEKIAYNFRNKIENDIINDVKNMKEYEKTSLKESINTFKNFIADLKNNYSSTLTENFIDVS